jgi:hypothetical protein
MLNENPQRLHSKTKTQRLLLRGGETNMGGNLNERKMQPQNPDQNKIKITKRLALYVSKMRQSFLLAAASSWKTHSTKNRLYQKNKKHTWR